MTSEVSVIVPVYNAAAYLDRCLVSLSAQTLKSFEVICVDDCSTDDSWEKLEEWNKRDPRIKIIKNPQNMGVSRTRNAGIKEAEGEYLAFADSDDFVSEDFLETMLQTARRENADIVCGSHVLVNGHGQKHNVAFENCYGNRADMVGVLSSGAVWDKLFKRSLVMENHIEFMPDVVFEDNLFVISAIMKAAKMAGCPAGRYFYVMVPNSLTHDDKKAAKRRQDSMLVAKALLKLGQQGGMEDVIKKFVFNNVVTTAFLSDARYYREMCQLLEDEKLCKQLSKMRWKMLRRKWFDFSWKRRKLTIFGIKLGK